MSVTPTQPKLWGEVILGSSNLGDIFDSSKLKRLFSLKRGKRDVRALSFVLRKCHPWAAVSVINPPLETIVSLSPQEGKNRKIWFATHSIENQICKSGQVQRLVQCRCKIF